MTMRQRVKELGPKGQYLLKTSTAVNTMVTHRTGKKKTKREREREKDNY